MFKNRFEYNLNRKEKVTTVTINVDKDGIKHKKQKELIFFMRILLQYN